ncbi:MAG TPA: NUDIX domain-containing protein [Croceibacterium sp.]
MTIWTPSPEIAVKVIGLAWRGAELLVAEVEESDGRVKGVRPLGGSIEFGETREAALVREFAEELGCAVSVTGPWHTFENLYRHEGAQGHEFIFAAAIRLGDEQLYRRDRFHYLEHEGTRCCAVWLDPLHLPAGVELYPTGLLDAIEHGGIRREP